jgi:hypothetical protein
MYSKLPYDPVRDFAPITLTATDAVLRRGAPVGGLPRH